MKFSGKMCLMIILKVTKNQGFTLCLEDTIFKNHRGGQIEPSPPLPPLPPGRFRVNRLLSVECYS